MPAGSTPLNKSSLRLGNPLTSTGAIGRMLCSTQYSAIATVRTVPTMNRGEHFRTTSTSPVGLTCLVWRWIQIRVFAAITGVTMFLTFRETRRSSGTHGSLFEDMVSKVECHERSTYIHLGGVVLKSGTEVSHRTSTVGTPTTFSKISDRVSFGSFRSGMVLRAGQSCVRRIGRLSERKHAVRRC